MNESIEANKTPVQLLAELARLCKEKKLVQKLANRLGVERQTIYLWDRPDCVAPRTAKLRLLEISRMTHSDVAPAITFAAEAVRLIDDRERGGLQ